MKVAFDVDGTLIVKNEISQDVPRYEVIEILKSFKNVCGAEIIVWSGSGSDYALRWVEKLGLTGFISRIAVKGSEGVDIAFDDEEVTLGNVNVKV